RKMRDTVERILAWLDLGEGNCDRLACIGFHVAGKLSHLVSAHVGIELRLDVGGDSRRIEGNVVGTTAYNHELDAVTLLDGDVRRLESIAFCVPDHVDCLRRAGDRRHGYAARR